MKMAAKGGGQYVMKRDQRGMFKRSLRAAITRPGDDAICRIEERASAGQRTLSNHLISATPPTAPCPCLPSYAVSPLQTVYFLCVCVCLCVCACVCTCVCVYLGLLCMSVHACEFVCVRTWDFPRHHN